MQSLYGAIANTNKKEIMVSIDTVYQRVLALANKEQRGYVTPQEFNLFANQAQMEIFEQYFYDIKQLGRIPGNDAEYSDPLSILYEKIGIFEVEEDALWIDQNMSVSTSGYRPIPNMIYKIGVMRHKHPAIPSPGAHIEILSSKNYDEALSLPLTSPSIERPIAKITNQGVLINPSVDLHSISFMKRPQKVEWAYVVVNDKALYNDNISINFELHQSEETKLVIKILELAGVVIKKPELYQVGDKEEIETVQQEKQ